MRSLWNDADAAQKLMRERTQLEEQLGALSQLERELDDAILSLRTNELDVGTWLLRTRGDADLARQSDALLASHQAHWLVNETLGLLRRTLARIDVSSRSLFALIDQGSCFVGALAELAFAADRAYMLELPDAPEQAPHMHLSEMNFGYFPMVNHQTRLQRRFYEEVADARGDDRADVGHGGESSSLVSNCTNAFVVRFAVRRRLMT